MRDWTDNAPQELKTLIEDSMAEGHHENFESFYAFLKACVDLYEIESSCMGEDVA